ncbi:excalibur calcium-binding domain-containing protein [Mycobacterium kubicae]|uniref:Excalibur calcium-binding domain-containing protein n=1 Tax=Mycobacterium kubicae TaxID=120959 RepID=A0AAX1JGC4_9MYCO|nr:excalibur calcium-binding domain-containing protein [Mycobacterium kubicae]MCV7097640.1 excalibur calcium-binding domain-containing protein [Mycobacterium kubicae]QNI14687.1 excalibur calcium-binding domain-containing protein [Mycobacterium kubicae]QPI40608.1 excalibur calcium-binding domain-containing protein [Mycobacterium kubicae]
MRPAIDPPPDAGADPHHRHGDLGGGGRGARAAGYRLDEAQRPPGPKSPQGTSRTVSPASSNLPHYYPNCDAAWADGRTNIPRGDADYHPALDRDGDGVACQRGGG